MIRLDDVIALSDLTEEEIAAIAEHEHTDGVSAAILGDYMMHDHHGPQKVVQMISEDIRAALHKDDKAHAAELYKVLHHFLAQHPDAARGAAG